MKNKILVVFTLIILANSNLFPQGFVSDVSKEVQLRLHFYQSVKVQDQWEWEAHLLQ